MSLLGCVRIRLPAARQDIQKLRPVAQNAGVASEGFLFSRGGLGVGPRSRRVVAHSREPSRVLVHAR